MPLKSRAIALSVGITSLAVISFQLVIMQLLSISQWHHFAYMVISMAMLGFGAAGTFLALFREWLKRNFDRAMPLLYLLCSLSMALSGRLVGIFGEFDTFLLFFDRSQIGLMSFTYLVYALPFFFAGLAITLVFYHHVAHIGTLYFFNLAGSAAGALVIIGLFWTVPLPLIPSLLALLPMLAAWMVRIRSRRFAALMVLFLLGPLSGILAPVTPGISEFKPMYGSLQLPDAEVIYEESGPYGLLQVVRAPAQRFAPALSLQYRGEPPVRDVLFNNGEYLGTLLGRLEVQGNDREEGHLDPGRQSVSTRHLLDYATRGLPFALRQPESVLVLKSATGTDVSHALAHSPSRVTAVEPNRQANRLLTDRRPEWIDSLYLHPKVSLYGSSVRTWLARNTDIRKDLIILPVIGAFGGTSGVHALQEEYHFTLEALLEMYDRLTAKGMIAVTVWAEYPPRNSLKLLATWRVLLEELGVDAADSHIMAVRNWGTITWILSRSAFTDEEVRAARAFSRNRSFDPLILPDVTDEERDYFNMAEDRMFFDQVDTLLYGNYEAFFRDYIFEIRPATDNRPFFSHFMTLGSVPGLLRQYDVRELPYMELGFILAAVTLVQIVLASVILIILPLFRVGWQGTRRRYTFLYFSGIGIGFMFFEIVLIQKLVLYLGQPVYATAAVLAALLLSSGAGSYASSRFRADHRTLLRTGGVIVVLILLYALLLMPLLDVSMSWPIPARVANVVVLLAPPAFFMGMMFPFGLRRLSGSNETQIPWACGVDSCLSVSATALATMIALETGFVVVMGVAAAAYALTTLASLRLGDAIQQNP
ncbi:MAG: spermidine synthase-like protein [Balneolaceae bacterium]|nr:MAG: spermidine synthase-like protein [Balneolaceae bacterium]